jgi:hypothetical protein
MVKALDSKLYWNGLCAWLHLMWALIPVEHTTKGFTRQGAKCSVGSGKARLVMPGEAMLSGHCAFPIGKVRLWSGLYTMGNQVKKSGYYYYLPYGD